jgi:DNA repair protein RecO (recombination protein O)
MRIFEMGLLEALGYGLELDSEAATGEPVRAERSYAYEAEHGLRATAFGDPDDEVFSGRELISLREHVLDDEQSLRSAQRLLGRVLRLYLGERPLKSRLVLQDIVRRGL